METETGEREVCARLNSGRLRDHYSADDVLPKLPLCLDVSGLGWAKLLWAEKYRNELLMTMVDPS